jgi:hypothetical protein
MKTKVFLAGAFSEHGTGDYIKSYEQAHLECWRAAPADGVWPKDWRPVCRALQNQDFFGRQHRPTVA